MSTMPTTPTTPATPATPAMSTTSTTSVSPTTPTTPATPATPATSKSGTQLLNEHKNRGHTIQYEEYTCIGHSQDNPQYGCRVWVNGLPKAVANNSPSKKKAKEAAALETAESLLLI